MQLTLINMVCYENGNKLFWGAAMKQKPDISVSIWCTDRKTNFLQLIYQKKETVALLFTGTASRFAMHLFVCLLIC